MIFGRPLTSLRHDTASRTSSPEAHFYPLHMCRVPQHIRWALHFKFPSPHKQRTMKWRGDSREWRGICSVMIWQHMMDIPGQYWGKRRRKLRDAVFSGSFVFSALCQPYIQPACFIWFVGSTIHHHHTGNNINQKGFDEIPDISVSKTEKGLPFQFFKGYCFFSHSNILPRIQIDSRF